jgi:hypothetical protein
LTQLEHKIDLAIDIRYKPTLAVDIQSNLWIFVGIIHPPQGIKNQYITVQNKITLNRGESVL